MQNKDRVIIGFLFIIVGFSFTNIYFHSVNYTIEHKSESLRVIRNPKIQVVSREKLKEILEPIAPKTEMIVSDVTGTVMERGKEMPEKLINLQTSVIKKIGIAYATGLNWKKIQERILSKQRQHLSNSELFFSLFAAQVWEFDKSSREFIGEDLVRLSSSQISAMESAVKAFKDKYGLELIEEDGWKKGVTERNIRYDIKLTTNAMDNIENYVSFLKEELKEKAPEIHVKVNKAVRKIFLTASTKGTAIKYLQEEKGYLGIIAIGDTPADLEMNLPGVTMIYVGKPKDLSGLSKEELKNVIALKDQGPKGSITLLKVLEELLKE